MGQEIVVSWQCLVCDREQKSRIKYDRKSPATGYFHQVEEPTHLIKEGTIFLECEKCGKKYLYPQDRLRHSQTDKMSSGGDQKNVTANFEIDIIPPAKVL